MPIASAGLLLYRKRGETLQVLLVHPGGPIWQNKDAGAWSIPKGEIEKGEEPLSVARREFLEETGFTVIGQFVPLRSIKMTSGKIVHAWAVEGDLDPAAIRSNTFTMEWPPKSGKHAEFPEVDRGEFLDLPIAKQKINPTQLAFLGELEKLVTAR